MARIGAYEILNRLARGGMAEVFLGARRLPDGTLQPVAIKRILPEVARDPDFVKMLLDEARLVAGLAHPNIARLVDMGREEGVIFLTLELVDGRDLRRVLADLRAAGRRLPAPLAAEIARLAALGLDHAHRATRDGRLLGIVHRDVCPANILLSFGGAVKVIDFGVARAAGRLTQTRAGVVKGKFRYMAPEQAQGKPVDARADLYSLGMVLYEALAGAPPLEKSADTAVMMAAIAGTIPPLSAGPDVPAELARIVNRALSRQLADRPASGAELAAELEAWLCAQREPRDDAALARLMAGLYPGGRDETARALAALG